jgi:hypothetical protein
MTGPEAVEALPDKIRVGPYDFRIEVWHAMAAAGNQAFGQCSTCEQTIRVQRDMPTAFKAVDTLFHEAGHAIYWAYGIQTGDEEERLVAVLGTALLALHRDNPWLSGWVTAALSDCDRPVLVSSRPAASPPGLHG